MSRLTTRAAQRYAEIGDNAEDAQNQVLAIQRRCDEIGRQLRHKNPETQAEHIAVLEDDLRRQNARLGLAQEAYADAARVHGAIATWLAGLAPSVVLEDVEDEPLPDMHTTEDHLAAVLRIREDVKDFTAARLAAERSLLPLDDLLKQVDAHVDELAERGRPKLRIDPKGVVFNYAIEGVFADQVMARLAFMDKESVRRQLRDEVEMMHDQQRRAGRGALSSDERARQLRSLGEEILTRERLEEALIRDADSFGTKISRRERANPLAILGLRIAPRASAKAA